MGFPVRVPIVALTALQVKKATKPGMLCDGGGLYLQIARGGAKSWIFRFQHQGRTHDMGLGGAGTFTLAEARERARMQRQLLADGINPLEAKREAALQRRMANASVITFDAAAARYISAQAPGWKSAKHAEQWRSTLATYASPIIGSLPAGAVDTELVMRVLTPIWTTRTETASRVRGRIEAVLDWCTVQGYRQGENPARWRGHLDKLLPARRKVAPGRHFAALPWRDMGAFMKELRGMPGTAALAVEFAILTATRTSETLNATWDEFDIPAATWTIPAGRMKAGREHVVPLSDAALHVLKVARNQSPEGPYVFAGANGGALSNMAGLALLKRMHRADLTVHGFRSTFRDWAGEHTAHPREVIERALAHGLKDKAEAAYARGTLFEKRRALMADWALWCNAPAGAAVVPIRAAAHA